MNKFVLPFSLLFASILILIFIYIFVEKHDVYKDSKTSDECTKNHNSNLTKDGEACGVWTDDDDNCWKGKYNAKDGTCVKPVDYVDLVLLILSIGLIFAFIVTLILAIRRKK
jgi:hypothetical protein